MARQKQATPLRREVSSEYTSAADRNGTAVYRQTRHLDAEVDVKPVKINRSVEATKVTTPDSPAKKQAGLLELVIGVSGIYASL